jgi:hypothetical protein
VPFDCAHRTILTLLNDPSKLARFSARGGLVWFPTAHVERPPFHRGGSVSTGNQPGHPSYSPRPANLNVGPIYVSRFVAEEIAYCGHGVVYGSDVAGGNAFGHAG